MHRCLSIPDIILEVVDNLSPPPEERLYHPQKFSIELRTLAMMARSCQLFYEPCINALWKVNHSLECVIRCLPLSVPAEICDPALLTRFFANAARVAYLRLRPHFLSNLGGHYGPVLDHHLALMRSYSGKRRVVFPKLQVLALDASCEEDAELIWELLFSPQLSKLILLSGLDMKDVEMVLLHTSEHCPNVKALVLSSWSSAWDTTLARLETLESITYNHSTRLHESTVLCLARLPRLRSLNILPPHIDHVAFSLPSNGFDNLEQLTLLEIHDSDVESVTSLLGSLSPGRLLHLDMHFDVDSRDTSLFNHMLNVIGENLWSLRTLSLLGWGPEVTGDAPGYDVDPLFHLNNLRSLSVRLVGMLACFTDKVIPRCGDAWPNLREFIFFQTLYYRMQPAGLTLKSLPLFAHHFPNLSRLALELDATGDVRNADTAMSSTKYIELDLSRSLISGEQDCAEVAAYISKVFPNCSMRHVLAPMRFRKTTLHEDEARCWERVMEMVEVSSKRGKNERFAATKEVWEKNSQSGVQDS